MIAVGSSVRARVGLCDDAGPMWVAGRLVAIVERDGDQVGDIQVSPGHHVFVHLDRIEVAA